MQKSVEYVVGIDISKQTFDVCLGASVANPELKKARFTNNLSGYESFVSWLLELSADISNVLFCLENTGMYHRQLVGYIINSSCGK